jgi:predicted N-acetyltransferase YhbS
MQACLSRARDAGWARLMLVGDAPYYRRYGFEVLSGIAMPPPTNPQRVLGVALERGAWDGVTGAVTAARD